MHLSVCSSWHFPASGSYSIFRMKHITRMGNASFPHFVHRQRRELNNPAPAKRNPSIASAVYFPRSRFSVARASPDSVLAAVCTAEGRKKLTQKITARHNTNRSVQFVFIRVHSWFLFDRLWLRLCCAATFEIFCVDRLGSFTF